MAQYRKDQNKLLDHNKTIYEVIMLADKEGNISSGGNFTGGAVDAFGRARISDSVTLFDSSNIYTENLKMTSSTTGTANTNYVQAESTVELNVSTGSGDEVIRQSKRRISYQPGKSLLLYHSFVFGSPKENMRQRIGYFDENDGIFLEQDGTDVYFVMRTSVSGSPVESRVAQSSWNGDILDGSEESTSGYTLDLTQSQILIVDIEWLGVGSVRCGFIIDGKIIYAHTFHNSNRNDTVYMTTPNHPMRAEITNTGATASASKLKMICQSAISEGGYDVRGKERMVGTASLSGVTVGTSWVSLVALRMKNSRTIVIPTGIEILNISNVDFEWALLIDPTPATAFSWTDYFTGKSQYSLETKTLSDLGTKIAGGYLGGKTAPYSLGQDAFAWEYQLGSTVAGVSEVCVLAIRAGSSSKAAAGILKWVEQ